MNKVITKSFSDSTKGNFKFAMLLSGLGVYDGSEVTESVSAMMAMSKYKIGYDTFSLNKDQFHVIDHTTGKEMNEKRNILKESSRIVRGEIKDMKELKSSDYNALLIPGGFGVAKNFSNFASANQKFKVDEVVAEVIKEFLHNQKPIAACCIAPILLGNLLGRKHGGHGAKLTLGKEGVSLK